MGAKCVIITGATSSNSHISDFIFRGKQGICNFWEKNSYYKSWKWMYLFCIHHSYRLERENVHIRDYSKAQRRDYVYWSIKNSKKIGKGINIAHKDVLSGSKELEDSINHFKQIKNIYKLIPECQTNFVFAKKNPKTIKDVLGISGRLVKSGKDVVTAGEIVYGGSRHVGTAVIEVNKKFPEIRSCVNIKYDTKIISKAKKSKFTVLSYNRRKEPKKSRHKENSSIAWGVTNSLKTKLPDIIYHKGDIGKEPMILIFGKNPKDVIRKVSTLRLPI